MLISNSLKLQDPKRLDTKFLEIGASSRPMGTKETGGRFAPTSIRIRVIRRDSAYPAPKDFAKFVGLTVPNLSNIENGFPISPAVQRLILTKFPWISRDWLMDGKEAMLPGVVLQRLAPLVAEESDTTKPRSRSKGRSGRKGA